MGTALEQMHEIDPHTRAVRARAGVLMLILSDALSVVAIMAAGGYLSALNTLNQYRLPKEHPPAFWPGLLLSIVLLLSGLAYYGWARSMLRSRADERRFFLWLAFLLMVLVLAGQIWIGVTLGYEQPFDAYVSLVLLFTWYSAIHFLLAVVIGLLVLGRALRGRMAGALYLVTTSGYWWYYTVVASLVMWVFITLLR